MCVWLLAVADGGKAATTAAKAAPVARGGIAEAEARMILNVKPKATEEEVAAAAESLLKMNDTEKGGSEYLQYKIRNARDSIVVPPPEPEPPKQEPPKKDDSSA